MNRILNNKQSIPWFLVCVVVLVAITAGLLVWQLNQHKPKTSGSEIALPAEPVEAPPNETTSNQFPEVDSVHASESPVTAQPTTEVADVIEEAPLTSSSPSNLDSSDGEVEQYLTDNDAASLNQWLVPEHKIRKLVRAINALDDGKLVSQYRPTEAPKTPFKAEATGDEQWQLSKSNFARYSPYISALEQVGTDNLVALYQHYSPLLEQAYEELGVDKGSFDNVSRGALQQIINAPEINQPIILTRPSVVYHYQDKQLEQLPELQKLLIRMGPENRARVKALAKDLLQSLEQQ